VLAGSLNLVFMGTPDFAVPTLQALIDAGHQISTVYTQPPRPAGRGHKKRRSAVHDIAEANRIPVRVPSSLKPPDVQEAFAACDADAAVVVAYGLLLPKAVLEAPRLGCINLHASWLPRWRGAAPIQWAILSGDTETGVCAMMMEEGLDTGPVLSCERTTIGPMTTAGELHDKLASLGAPLMLKTLAGLAGGAIGPTPQPDVAVTWAPKIQPGDSRLDWGRSAVELERVVRAMAPTPGAWFEHDDARIKVTLALATESADEAVPGTVIDEELTVRCADGALRLLSLQRAGREAMSATNFLRGYQLDRGTILPVPLN